jgi:trimeric autotransporter adhesin
VGVGALLNNSNGSHNIAVGDSTGRNLTSGNSNIYVGNPGVGAGEGAESRTIRIGTPGTQTKTFVAGIYAANEGGAISPVYINSNGQLGTQPPASARRFKKDIKPMDDTSGSRLALKPVTFHYKNDKTATAQFGLIAEEVAKVNPDLVVCDKNGEIYTVRYDQVNAMLLNEFLKEHKKTEKLEATVASLITTVKEQAAQIQK